MMARWWMCEITYPQDLKTQMLDFSGLGKGVKPDRRRVVLGAMLSQREHGTQDIRTS